MLRSYTVKLHKKTYVYEICDYSYSPNEKYVKVTEFYKGEYEREESFDLTKLDPEFYEQTEYSPRLPVYALAISSLILMLSFMWIMSPRWIEFVTLLWLGIPLVVLYCAAGQFLKRTGICCISEFCFSGNIEGELTVLSQRWKRSKAYAFACEIAKYCNPELIEKSSQDVIKHQFVNGLAELRDRGIVLFNTRGVKKAFYNYDWVVPGTCHHVENHMVRNIFCILLAAVFWGGACLMLIGVALATHDWLMTLGFGMLYIIPFILGVYILSKLKRSQNYYFAGNRFDDGEYWGIYLQVSKKYGGEKGFIDELNARLRKAYENRRRNG